MLFPVQGSGFCAVCCANQPFVFPPQFARPVQESFKLLPRCRTGFLFMIQTDFECQHTAAGDEVQSAITVDGMWLQALVCG